MLNHNSVRLFTIKELIECCRVGRTFLYQEVKAGRLKAIKIGRVTRFKLEDVEAWLSEFRVVTNPFNGSQE